MILTRGNYMSLSEHDKKQVLELIAFQEQISKQNKFFANYRWKSYFNVGNRDK